MGFLPPFLWLETTICRDAAHERACGSAFARTSSYPAATAGVTLPGLARLMPLRGVSL
jgi:hypothetical protein